MEVDGVLSGGLAGELERLAVDANEAALANGVGSAKRTLFGHVQDENIDPRQANKEKKMAILTNDNHDLAVVDRPPPSACCLSSSSGSGVGVCEEKGGMMVRDEDESFGAASDRDREHRERDRESQQHTHARLLASEAKSIEVAVLRLYESTTTEDEIDETVFVNHDENCVFENPLMKLKGVCEIRSLFQLVKKSFWSFNIVRPVKVGLWLGGKDGEGAKLLLDYKIEYQVLPFTPKVSIHQFTHLTINLEGRVIEHKDDWSVTSLIQNVPFVGSVLYPIKQRAVGLMSASMGSLIQPRASFIYKMILQS